MRGRFEILVGKTSIGADISWLSQFFGEEEFCYKPLTHLLLVGEARLEEHNGKQLSILQMKLTVNQRSKTVEQAEVARKDFLTQLASSLEWDVRHWAKRQELLERLAPAIADMRAALQAVVAEVEASKLNDNEQFGTIFGRVIEVSEEKRQELAESVWQDGEAARGRGEADAAAALFEKAIDARGRGLCADDKQGRDRIVAMRRVVMEVRGGRRKKDKKKQAWDKMKLASDLNRQGALEEALALYQEALELFTEVRFQYATSMCACACIALHRGLIFHDLYVSRATGFSLPVAYILFLLLGSLFAARCLLFVFTTGGRPRLPGRGQDSREHGYHLPETGPLRPSP